MDFNELSSFADTIKRQTHEVVMGNRQAVELMLIALLCRGHVLLEGVPGTAKTLLARTFAATLDLTFKRIQFTPDLMPGDIIGTNLFNFTTNQFTLTKGPLFTDILLADEINRTPPKTQAALLEAMQERTVTIDGTSHPLGSSFMVIATQNPIEQQGTYPLPEAQLDRFLFKIPIHYPSYEEECSMLHLHGNPFSTETTVPPVKPVVSGDVMRSIGQLIAQTTISNEIVEYIAKLIRASRDQQSLLCGASPRAAIMLATAARCRAALDGRDFVLPDDIKWLLLPLLEHRLVLAPGAEIEGTTVVSVLDHLIATTTAPR